MIAMKEWE